MPQITAIYSPAPQSGKSTVANYLVNFYGYRRIPFAGLLKEMMRPLYKAQGYSDEDIHGFETIDKDAELHIGTTPRRLYQTIGTEWGRNCINESLWIRLWAMQAMDSNCPVVVDDMRFPNEYQAVRALGGKTLKVYNPNMTRLTNHASEGALDNCDFDHTIVNVGSLADLYYKVGEIPWVEAIKLV